MVDSIHAFVNVQNLYTPRDIGNASRHAKGIDEISKKRRREGLENRIAICEGYGGHGLELSKAFAQYVEDHGARHYKNSARAMHLIIGVSPAWLELDGGSMHDPENPRVKQLLVTARDWVNKEFAGVFAARIDLDERGGGVVDVLCSPIHPHGRSGKPFISIRKAKNVFADKHGIPRNKSYTGFQDSWLEYAQEHLDPTIERGESKEVTRAERMRPEEYGAMKDKQREIDATLESVRQDKTTLQEKQKELDARERRIRLKENELERSGQALQQREYKATNLKAELDDRQNTIRTTEQKLRDRFAALKEREGRIEGRDTQLRARDDQITRREGSIRQRERLIGEREQALEEAEETLEKRVEQRVLQPVELFAQRLLEMWKLVRQTLARIPLSSELHPLLKAARDLEVDYPNLEPGSPIADDLARTTNLDVVKAVFERNEHLTQDSPEQGGRDAKSGISEVLRSPNPFAHAWDPHHPEHAHYARSHDELRQHALDRRTRQRQGSRADTADRGFGR